MSAPQKAQSPAATGQSAEQITDVLIVADAAEHRKRMATLVAKLALRGHAVHTTAEGGFLVCWHGYVRHCPDIVALEAFAKQVGAL
ncbi:MAG: hypothetical protein PWQ61_1585 [Betaproteobacteria bacterium]|nr:hypothetical protein [Betaproteobacteria bacterium]